MVVLGVPRDIENYFIADSEIAFILQQKGFCPRYKDNEVLYFQKTKKLIETLKKFNIE